MTKSKVKVLYILCTLLCCFINKVRVEHNQIISLAQVELVS